MDEVIEKDNERGKAEFYLATVTNWFPATSEAQIKLDGDDAKMTKKYKTACGSVSVDSRVVVMKMSGTYVILGAINEATYRKDASVAATIASGFVFRTGGYVARWGKVAMAYIRFAPTSSKSSGTHHICTLNAGYRPIIPADAQYWAGAGGYIDTDGKVYVYGTPSDTSGNYALYSTFIIA